MAQVGLGCMRLTDAAVIRAALEAGVTLFDTARAYGDSERLVGATVPPGVEIVTKAGMSRPGGAWVPDGRARAIRADAQASVAALGRVPDLLLLHAPDPRVALATSVRALVAAQRAGLCRSIGLSNVSRPQLEEAAALAPVAAVQLRLDWRDALDESLLAFCRERGIRVLAHSPLGGPRRAAAALAKLAPLAAKHGATEAEIALAWLVDQGVSPLAGATRVETARSLGRVAAIRLDDDDRAILRPRRPAAIVKIDGEIVMIIGSPAAGKSTAARAFVDAGHQRLNRDESGGTLAALARALDAGIAAGGRRFVLDNTYATRRSRQTVVEVAAAHGLPLRCVWLDTSLDDAQVNACWRGDALPPRALFRFRDAFEPPAPDEGFAAIERVPFTRRPDPTLTARGFIVDVDHTLWRSAAGARAPTTPADVILRDDVAALLRARRAEGYVVAGVTWQAAPGCLDRLQDLLGFALPVENCPHPAGPPVCWCRKPLPGLGVALIRRLALDPARTIHLGDKPADKLFAHRLGFAYQTA